MQQKLFATSRVVRDLDAEDNLPPMASIERDRKMKMKPPAGKRGHQVSACPPHAFAHPICPVHHFAPAPAPAPPGSLPGGLRCAACCSVHPSP